jgi:hypothetical protein
VPAPGFEPRPSGWVRCPNHSATTLTEVFW